MCSGCAVETAASDADASGEKYVKARDRGTTPACPVTGTAWLSAIRRSGIWTSFTSQLFQNPTARSVSLSGPGANGAAGMNSMQEIACMFLVESEAKFVRVDTTSTPFSLEIFSRWSAFGFVSASAT